LNYATGDIARLMTIERTTVWSWNDRYRKVFHVMGTRDPEISIQSSAPNSHRWNDASDAKDSLGPLRFPNY